MGTNPLTSTSRSLYQEGREVNLLSSFFFPPPFCDWPGWLTRCPVSGSSRTSRGGCRGPLPRGIPGTTRRCSDDVGAASFLRRRPHERASTARHRPRRRPGGRGRSLRRRGDVNVDGRVKVKAGGGPSGAFLRGGTAAEDDWALLVCGNLTPAIFFFFFSFPSPSCDRGWRSRGDDWKSTSS